VKRSLDTTLPGFGRALQTEDAESVDARMVAFMRCLLAYSALTIIYFDPTEPARLAELTYALLSAYAIYGTILAGSIWLRRPLIGSRARPWADVLCCALLIGLTDGTNSIFFHFFFFAILVASFSHGFREGLLVTVASALLFIVVGLAADALPSHAAVSLDRALIRPTYLLLLGYMIAYWGGHELALRRRLRLLRKLARVANPRLGVDHAFTEGLRRLVEFFNAELGLLVRPGGAGAPHLLYRVQARAPERQAGPESVTESFAHMLLEIPAANAISWAERRRIEPPELDARCRRMAEFFGTPCFMTVPCRERDGPPGRLYIAARRPFTAGEADFLGHAVEQMSAAVDNVVLLDKLMANAAQLERARIARDIHDTTVQPYIGLRLGLQALQRRLPEGSPFAPSVRELVDMTSAAVEDVRGYIRGLRETQPAVRGEALMDGLHTHLGRYRNFYAIDVELRGEPKLTLSDKVAGEVYQIVCEALSNVYRHTRARSAYVALRRDADSLQVEIGNGREPGAAAPFTPRSILERARSLGGDVDIRLNAQDHDVVAVRIPL